MDDNISLLSAHAKTMIAGTVTYFGFTLDAWMQITAIVFAVVNTIAVLPSTIRTVKSIIEKVKNRGRN